MNQKYIFLILTICALCFKINAQEIPLSEHPRPDFERKEWTNLNGKWAFAFDSLNLGIKNNWALEKNIFNKVINVPFPWGSKLSGVEDEADIAWYKRDIKVSSTWQNKRTFLTIGASDWETTVWLDGVLIGKHQGGYVPFSFELTNHIKYDKAQNLVVRVDDARREFTLYGKQGYGNARGIWQTIYLEARGKNYLDAIHFTPDIDNQTVEVTAFLPEESTSELNLKVSINSEMKTIDHQVIIPKGKNKISFVVDIPNPHLWTLDDPYLYEVKASLNGDDVYSYFGMRKISTSLLPGTEIPYISINNEPIYLQLALDQSYHPEGFYTFPSDQFIQEEIIRSKSIGLNGIRTHIKVEIPRKLYWADKLGLLVMEDLPNSWGEPDEKMQAEAEYTLREMIKRDYNHPSIFSWIVFNETWGLTTKTLNKSTGKLENQYLPKTQNWVASMYYLAKSLDQSRLVEDNSICCGRGHTETDIYSWHSYLPGWEWDDYLENLTSKNYPGSQFDFENGFLQGNQPNINSECGNVWGYDGSTGDVDWSWDYHRMMNSFRKFPKVAGWLYTEHHDVINEWNGYWRFDRTEKHTGLEEIIPGMTLNDFHSKIYLSTGNEISLTVKGGSTQTIPLFISSMSSQQLGNKLNVTYELEHNNFIGESSVIHTGQFEIEYSPYMQKSLAPLTLTMAQISGVSTLKLFVKDQNGNILHRNFMYFIVDSDQKLNNIDVFNTPINNYKDAKWSQKYWDVLDGKKLNGAGKGYFVYDINLPKNVGENFKKASFLVEVSAKEFFVKDQKAFNSSQDYMKGSVVAPSSNPNSYPMTDDTKFLSTISISIDGEKVKVVNLADDPADHRGVLSWHNQLKDKKLREAGSYGYLVEVPLNKVQLRKAVEKGFITVKLESEGEGGIAVYGQDFGRFRLNPSIVIRK